MRTAPPAIQPAIERLAARLTSRWTIEDALHGLATDLNDATGDLIVAHLQLAAKELGAPDGLIGCVELATMQATDALMRHPDIGIILATLLGTPIGVLAGIYLGEYGQKTWLGSAVRFINDILLSAPSIVIGLFIYAVVVAPLRGFSGFAGILALMGVMLSLATSPLRVVAVGISGAAAVVAWALPLKLNIVVAIAVAVVCCLLIDHRQQESGHG